MHYDPFFNETDFEDLTPKMQGLVASSINCATLELLDILPEEPKYKETTMKNVMKTIASALRSAPCPLVDVKADARMIRESYEGMLTCGVTRHKRAANFLSQSINQVKSLR